MSENMWDDGYRNITNVDFSPQCISLMQKRCADKPGMTCALNLLLLLLLLLLYMRGGRHLLLLLILSAVVAAACRGMSIPYCFLIPNE